MFNNHSMSVVTDLAMIGPAINDANYIRIAAITNEDYPKLPNIFNCNVLIPPTEILMRWADGDPYAIQRDYPRYLMTKECDDIIVALIAAMTKRNIVIFIPNDEFMVYGLVLLQHLQFVYGITTNFVNSKFSVDPTKIPFILAKFYMIDVMEYEDFMASYPANAILPEFVIYKMSQEFPMAHATFADYVNYFNSINAAKTTQQRPKVNMVNIVSKGGN